MVLANALISILFLLFNNVLWTESHAMSMNPFEIFMRGGGMDFTFITIYPNLLFWLFWVSTAVNLSFIVWLYRSKEKKQNTA